VSLPKEIAEHYGEGFESKRLFSGTGELERVRTESILARHLPPPPALVLDIGGAAGVYAIPLARLGYQVHLTDAMELHVKQAREAASAAGVTLARIQVGDARRLDEESNSADAVLLFGPLYHLLERDDRMLALREAHRVLKPGGILLAAGISRFASLMDGFASGFFADPVFRSIVDGDLNAGRHQNPTTNPFYFTTAYFHRPEELQEEVRAAGFADVKILAVEGPVWSGAGFAKAWADSMQRRDLLGFLERVEGEASILGASAHLIALATRS